MNVREAALKTLYDIEFNGTYSNAAVKNALAYYKDMSAQDKPLFTELVYGVTDKRLTLDYYIKSMSKIKMKKISQYILIILRMGIYQLLYTDKIPESAAVNESVKLAKRYGHGASAGFVNGILRNVKKTEIKYPEDKTEYLSVKYSYPVWICEKWIKEFGFEFAEKMMAVSEKEKKITLRPNSLKTNAELLVKALAEENVTAHEENDAVVTDGFDISRSRLYNKGYYTPQDTAAMQAAVVLNPQPGETVIDMCAAPGGKTTHMAELMKNEGIIYAFDKYDHKIRLIEKNAERLDINIIKASAADVTVPNTAFKETADKILCDVPCSGLGIIGRKPDIKWNREENADLTAIQKKILENAAVYLKRGGEIVYSTCTVEREENEGVTGGFIKEHGEFEKLYEKTFYPHIDGTDGFYICKLKKRETDNG